jgi:hypothetical protein
MKPFKGTMAEKLTKVKVIINNISMLPLNIYNFLRKSVARVEMRG